MKIKLLLFVLLVISLSACGKNPLMNSDEEKIMEVTQQIVDITLPTGFNPEFTANMRGYNFVSFTTGYDSSHLYLLQSTDPADKENLQKMMNDLLPGESDMQSRQEVVENYPITISEQEATMVHSKGINSDGKEYQQVLVGFEGKGGPALFIYSSLSTDWDLEEVINLVNSID